MRMSHPLSSVSLMGPICSGLRTPACSEQWCREEVGEGAQLLLRIGQVSRGAGISFGLWGRECAHQMWGSWHTDPHLYEEKLRGRKLRPALSEQWLVHFVPLPGATSLAHSALSHPCSLPLASEAFNSLLDLEITFRSHLCWSLCLEPSLHPHLLV